MKTKRLRSQERLFACEARAAFAQDSQLKPESFNRGFKEDNKMFRTSLRKVTCLLALACFAALAAASFAQSFDVGAHDSGAAVSRQNRGHLAALNSRKRIHKLGNAAKPPSSGDDNENTTPTAWWMYSGQTPAQVSNTITQDNARIIDITVDSFSPYSFTVTYVQNTGSYQKGWWWYYGINATTLGSLLSSNNARPISLKAYDIGGGQIRFAVAMISNTGADQKDYWYYYDQTPSDLFSLAAANNARLTTIQSYTTDNQTLYAAIMISNSGADANGWWLYYNVTAEQIGSALSANNARALYLNSAGGGLFNVVMESCANGCAQWWWYVGITANDAVSAALQNGARIVSTDQYPGCGGQCVIVSMLNNSNAITTRVGNILRANNPGGVQGLYLKQVGGPVLAALEDGVAYEPASSIKVLIHLYAMTQVQNGAVSLSQQIPHYTNGPDSCPDPPDVNGTEPLFTALQEMMWHSDNARTRELTDYFTDSSINAFAKSIGMQNTSINEIIGCVGAVADSMTQDDAAVLYQGVANQTLLDNVHRGIFYSLMAGKAQFEAQEYDWTGLWKTDLPTIISQEAPPGYTQAQELNFQNAMNLAYKAGNYTVCGSSCVYDYAISGWFEVPTCNGSTTNYNQYVFGVFLSNATNGTTASTNFFNAAGELMREQVQAGLDACYQQSLNIVNVSPSPANFGVINVGSSSSPQTISVFNHQNVALKGISIATTGDFSQTNNCGTSIAANASCTVQVVFKPSIGGLYGALVVTDGASNTPQGTALIGAARYYAAMQTMDRYFVTAVNGGGLGGGNTALYTNATTQGAFETFTLNWVNQQQALFALQTKNGDFVTAVNGGDMGGPNNDLAPIHTDATTIGSWQHFMIIVQADNSATVQTCPGYYLTAVNGGGFGGPNNVPIHTDATQFGGWEEFTLVPSSCP